MDAREERGLIIAAKVKLNRTSPNRWLVPSQTGAERIYEVDPVQKTCTCPDHKESGYTCKHIHAVKFTIERETREDGTIIETRSITLTEKKIYRQDWTSYNLAQTTERHRFSELLFDLCKGIPAQVREPGQGGRPRVPMADVIFAIALKIYGTLSSRRTACDIKDAHAKGYLSRPIHYNSVNGYLENAEVTPILERMIGQSAMPLRSVDHDFAIDSSGFSTSKFIRWYDEKYGITRKKHSWVKVHLCTATKSNIVTAVRILDKDAADSPQFVPLAKETAERFTIAEMSSDKAYLSYANLEVISELGGTPFIAFKENSWSGRAGTVWQKMYGYYQFRQQEFMNHYHKRSNVESTFSMIKRKFGDAVRSKSDVAMKNEVLGKILCHNICVVIASQCELGIEPVFWPEERSPNDRILTVGPV